MRMRVVIEMDLDNDAFVGFDGPDHALKVATERLHHLIVGTCWSVKEASTLHMLDANGNTFGTATRTIEGD